MQHQKKLKYRGRHNYMKNVSFWISEKLKADRYRKKN